MPHKFADSVKQYLAITKELATGQGLVKQLRVKAKQLEQTLCSYMAAQDISAVRCSGGGKLIRKVRRRRQPVTKSAVVDCCMQHMQNPQSIQDALDALKEQSGTVTKEELVYAN